MISVSSLMRTPMALRNACVSASVLLISMEKISLAAMVANGVSSPNALAMPIAIAVLPVPGWPASSTARPAMWPALIIPRICGGAHGDGGSETRQREKSAAVRADAATRWPRGAVRQSYAREADFCVGLRCAARRSDAAPAAQHAAAAAALTGGGASSFARSTRPRDAEMTCGRAKHHAGRSAGLLLADHALADVPCLERVI